MSESDSAESKYTDEFQGERKSEDERESLEEYTEERSESETEQEKIDRKEKIRCAVDYFYRLAGDNKVERTMLGYSSFVLACPNDNLHMIFFNEILKKYDDIPTLYVKFSANILIADDFSRMFLNKLDKLHPFWNTIRFSELLYLEKSKLVFKNLGTYESVRSELQIPAAMYLPRMIDTDPVVRINRFKLGDIIKIERQPSLNIYYRIVTK